MKVSLNILWFVLLLGVVSCRGTKESVSTPAFDPENLPEVSKMEQLESTAQLIEGGKQRMLGNQAAAILSYAEAVKADPRNSAAYYELAKLHAQQDYLEDAEDYALKAIALDPENKFFSMLLADIYFAREKNDKGLEVQQLLAEQFPTDLNIQISLLSTLLHLERYKESLLIFDHLEEISGFNNELSLQKQRVYMEMENPEKALEEAERLVSYYPSEPLYLELLAELYRENDQPEKAVTVYRKMLEEDPENAMARLLLADFYRNLGDTEKSFVELVKAFESPQLGIDGKVRILVSYYFLSEEDTTYLDQAWQLCKILVETHPEEAQAHALYGDFLMREQKNEQARQRYETAIKLDPAELSYWEQLLSLQIRLSDHEALLESSAEALEYFFEQPLLYFFHGLANYYLDQYEPAIAAFNTGLGLAIDNAELRSQFYTLLGDTYYKSGEYNKAYENYEQALEINPDDAYALNNYSYYLSMRNENLEKALTMSARSLEIEPNNASFQDTYGWIKYKLGDYKQAEVWIKKSLDNSEEPNAVVLEHYGDVLYKLGEKQQALLYWEKALEADRKQESVDGVSEFLEKKVKEGTLFE